MLRGSGFRVPQGFFRVLQSLGCFRVGGALGLQAPMKPVKKKKKQLYSASPPSTITEELQDLSRILGFRV